MTMADEDLDVDLDLRVSDDEEPKANGHDDIDSNAANKKQDCVIEACNNIKSEIHESAQTLEESKPLSEEPSTETAKLEDIENKPENEINNPEMLQINDDGNKTIDNNIDKNPDNIVMITPAIKTETIEGHVYGDKSEGTNGDPSAGQNEDVEFDTSTKQAEDLEMDISTKQSEDIKIINPDQNPEDAIIVSHSVNNEKINAVSSADDSEKNTPPVTVDKIDNSVENSEEMETDTVAPNIENNGLVVDDSKKLESPNASECIISAKDQSEECDSLLQVSDEITAQADEIEFLSLQEEEDMKKDDADEETDEAPNIHSEEEGTKDDSDFVGNVDNIDMDIEENSLSLSNAPIMENIVSVEINSAPTDEESDKENKKENMPKPKLENVVSLESKELKEVSKKRASCEPENESACKKAKLETTINGKLSSISSLLMDRSLKSMTREQLELFMLQKIGEEIVYKNKIGNLQLKVKMQESTIDHLRKDVATLAKTARDLITVHEKVAQDLARFKQNPDTPLIIPRITRSVGLQAVCRIEPKKKVISCQLTKPAVAVTPIKKLAPSTPLASTATKLPSTGVKPSASKKSPLRRNTPAKDKTANVIPTTKPPEPKGVIDLTDEEDRRVPSTELNGTKSLPPDPQKVVVVNNRPTVLVKLGNNQSASIPVTTSNGVMRTIPIIKNIPANKQASALPIKVKNTPILKAKLQDVKHPAPLPVSPVIKNFAAKKPPPPKPRLILNKTKCGTGIILSWKMPCKLDLFEEIASYQLYAYQETRAEPSTHNWGKIGDVKALALPMAVTLTQFAMGNRYYFAVRAVDTFARHGDFSDCQTILL